MNPFDNLRNGAASLLSGATSLLPEAGQRFLRRKRNRRLNLPSLSIGILTGDAPWALADDDRWPRPIITSADVTDAPAAFVADPFAIERNGRWYLFFEFMNRSSGKGEIGYAFSDDLASWSYRGRVLNEPFHLSYPAIYEFNGQTWMIPETWEARQVRLYRAVSFPDRWVLDRVLLYDVAGTDPTLYRTEDGTWSMLLCSAEGQHNRTLWHFVAPDLSGPWSEAADSPLVTDRPDQARPGGSVIQFAGQRYRMGQDCSTRYGEALRAYPLKSPWNQGGRDVLTPSGVGWRSLGGHHADIHMGSQGELLAFVDGESSQ